MTKYAGISFDLTLGDFIQVPTISARGNDVSRGTLEKAGLQDIII